MCFGIPMQVRAIDGLMVRCEARGIEREASLLLLQHEKICVGDYLVLHLGHAIERISAEQAAAAWDIYDEMLAVYGEHAQAQEEEEAAPLLPPM